MLPIVLLSLPLISLAAYATMCVLFARGMRPLRPFASSVNRPAMPPPPSTLGVTLLKSCAGADEALESCLESYFALEHPTLQILLGVHSLSDPAAGVIRRVIARYPERDASLVCVDATVHASPKINTLAGLELHARHDIVWLSDSNTHVAPESLRAMLELLDRPGVGIVAAITAGEDERTWGAALDNLAANTWVTFGAVATHALTGSFAGAGKSLLMRRRTLVRAGGWAPMGRHFADDTVIVRAVRALGMTVAIAPDVVRCPNAHGSIRSFVARHSRWSQIRFALVPASLASEVLCAPIAVAALCFAFGPTRATAGVLALAAFAQLAGDGWITRRLRGRTVPFVLFPVVLLRPFAMAALHIRTLFTRQVHWRGRNAWIGEGSEILERPPTRAAARGRIPVAFGNYPSGATVGPPVAAHAARTALPTHGSD